MSNSNQEISVSISSNALKEFARISKKVEETNIFPFLLQEDNYTKLSEYLYKRGDDHLIKVFYENNKWQYTNLKNSYDKGTLVQFIANRWKTESVQLAKSPTLILQAAKVANKYYEIYVKSLKNEHKGKPILLGSTSAQRRGR